MERISDRKKLLIFINIMISGIATSMLSTAMSTALPAVIEYYGVSLTTGQWVTSGYSLAMAIVMPLTAFLVKRIPTKNYIFREFYSLLWENYLVLLLRFLEL